MTWIFFDAVGTLFGVRGSVGGQYARAAQLFGAHADPGLMEHIFHEVFDASPPMTTPKRTRVREFERQWWKNLVGEVCRRAGITLDLDPYFDYLFRSFATARCWQLYPDAAATLKLLTRNGCRIGLISNFDSRLSGLLKDLGLQPWIAQVTISARVGVAKPDPGIFLAACVQANAKPANACYVGDSPSHDYYGARKAGMQAVLLDRDNLHSNFDGARVRRLSALFEKLSVGERESGGARERGSG